MIRGALNRLSTWANTWPRRILAAAAVAAIFWALVGWYGSIRPLPPDLSFAGDPVAMQGIDIRLLTDLTYRGVDGAAVHEQQIFDEILTLVDGAQRLIVLDLFLINDHLGLSNSAFRPISSELVGGLIAAHRRAPEMPIVLVTDPINDIYGGDPSPQLEALREAGIQVVVTDLTRLRDSNPLYSGLWRAALQWWGNSADGGWLPNPLDPDGRQVGLRTYLRMANFKANHRKVVLADSGDRWISLVTSANPHDGSSAHSNVALRVESGAFARQVFRTEMEVVRMSGGTPPFKALPDLEHSPPIGDHRVALVTESAIRDRVLELIDGAGSGDEIDLAIFYLSHSGVVSALRSAADRGVWIRGILDPNRDAFGREKSGVPNRQTAEHLIRTAGGGVAIRWYDTHGEQFHCKFMVVRSRDRADVVLGSANFTRRNLDDYNLEASVWVQTPRGSTLDRELKLLIDRLWTNDGGSFTLPYAEFRDTSKLRRLSAWGQETTGLSTF